MKKQHKFSLMLVVVAFLFSCSGTINEFSKMNQLQQLLSKKFATKDISLKIMNGSYISISLVNTSYNDSLPEVKQRLACECGSLVITVFNPENKIKGGDLAFVKKSNYVVMSSSNSYSYDMKIDSLIEFMNVAKRNIIN